MPLVIDQDVIRLDVAVDHVLAVSVVERARHLVENALDFGQRDRAAPDTIRQRSAVGIRHDEVENPVFVAVVVEWQNVGMLQAGNRACFQAENA